MSARPGPKRPPPACSPIRTMARSQPILDNPLGGLQAWCGDPQPYLNSIVDVSAYAGQTVQFRLRLGTDSSVGDGLEHRRCDRSKLPNADRGHVEQRRGESGAGACAGELAVGSAARCSRSGFRCRVLVATTVVLRSQTSGVFRRPRRSFEEGSKPKDCVILQAMLCFPPVLFGAAAGYGLGWATWVVTGHFVSGYRSHQAPSQDVAAAGSGPVPDRFPCRVALVPTAMALWWGGYVAWQASSMAVATSALVSTALLVCLSLVDFQVRAPS